MIDMMQAAEHGFPGDLSVLRFAVCPFDRAWGALTDRTVWAPAIKVVDVFRQHRPQMAFIQDEHVVQTFGSSSFPPSPSPLSGIPMSATSSPRKPWE